LGDNGYLDCPAPPAQYYVYALFRPDDGGVCYIGKGNGGRIFQSAKTRAFIVANGGEIPVVKLRSGLTASEAHEIERALIAAIGRECDGGPLLNVSTGGASGYAGVQASPELRAKLSAVHRGKPKSPEHRARIGAANLGQKKGAPSAATRAKMREAHKRRPPISAETRAKLSEAQRRRVWTDAARATAAEACARLSGANVGRKMSPESIAKRIAAFKATRAANRLAKLTAAEA
jgi:hypothetical protein